MVLLPSAAQSSPGNASRGTAPTAEPQKNVVGFWDHGSLSYLRRVCLASQVQQGYSVTLYSYTPVADLPKGVVNADAATVIPPAFRQRLERVVTRHDIGYRAIIQLSDFIRVRLQKLGLGVWLDTDLYLLRPMTIDTATPYFAWETFSRIGNSVLYLPPAHPIIDLYENLMEQDELIPDCISLHHRLKLQLWRWWGRRFNPSDLKLAMFGPLALTAFARRTGAMKYALPRRSFYSVHASHRQVFTPSRFQPLIESPDLIGLHVSPKQLEFAMPVPGSLYEWMARNTNMIE